LFRDTAWNERKNRNLHHLLLEEESAGRIELESVVRDAVGFHPGYVASVAVWHSRA